MYVIVRQDLDSTYRMVQGAHALSQFAIDYPKTFLKWNNQTIVFLSVKHEGQLYKLSNKLSELNIDSSIFYEEDLDGEGTSLACYSDSDILEKYNVVR